MSETVEFKGLTERAKVISDKNQIHRSIPDGYTPIGTC